jgi:hypothetical protein
MLLGYGCLNCHGAQRDPEQWRNELLWIRVPIGKPLRDFINDVNVLFHKMDHESEVLCFGPYGQRMMQFRRYLLFSEFETLVMRQRGERWGWVVTGGIKHALEWAPKEEQDHLLLLLETYRNEPASLRRELFPILLRVASNTAMTPSVRDAALTGAVNVALYSPEFRTPMDGARVGTPAEVDAVESTKLLADLLKTGGFGKEATRFATEYLSRAPGN